MARLLTLILIILVNIPVHAAINTSEIKYKVGDKEFTGFVAYDDAIKGKRPGILVVHEWWGHDANIRNRAKMLAGLGYTAFALDMYGSGILAEHPKDAKTFSSALFSNKEQIKDRLKASYQILKNHETVTADKTVAIGYCMGGALALGLGRSGADLDGIIVLHGSLGTKTPAKPGAIKGKVLVLTGDDDPFVPAEQRGAFKKEMDAAGVQYEMKVYPGTRHAFTVKKSDERAKKFNLPVAYNKAADEDSWQRVQDFLKDAFK